MTEEKKTPPEILRKKTPHEILREPFPAELIGKLPRVVCRACNDRANRTGTCDRHPQKVNCDTCGRWISSAHIHLDYVGHADATDRLLQADPEWTWEPAERAADPDLLKAAIASGNSEIVRMVIDNSPARLDEFGGMWIKLTVAGVTRLGYADAAGKTGPNARKELIGDGIRNAAMRFGVALELWAKGDREAGAHDDGNDQAQKPPTRTTPPKVKPDPTSEPDDQPPAEDVRAEAAQTFALSAYRVRTEKALYALFLRAKNDGLLSVEVADPKDGDLMTLTAYISKRKHEVNGAAEDASE